MKCYFCGGTVSCTERQNQPSMTEYYCPICGEINLNEEAAEDFDGERFSDEQKRIISCVLRNEYERRGKKHPISPLQIEDLHRFVNNYDHLSPLEKLDYALLLLGRMSKKIGDEITVITARDFPLFHCFDDDECHRVLGLLLRQDLIDWIPVMGGPQTISLNHKGYERLQQLQKLGANSSTCFVAMWYTPEMQMVYDQAVKPAIEFIEDGQTESRYKAIKLDNVEHINNINDEIIAGIRRSRFMVCDLTGYRGGVYFEAGFAYGLGLPVIYTCRKDWAEDEVLKDQKGAKVEELFYGNGIPMRIRKEGIHFDLAHMNRIEWEEDKLDDFRKALEVRIKAVIV